MGKHNGKNKKSNGEKSGESHFRETKGRQHSPRANDKETAIFVLVSRELKDEGNIMFQSRDYEGAMFKYEKAISLLPRNHADVSCLRSNMAACYMQLGVSEFPKAIHECNLSLEVTPNYSKALLKRARCYEALGKLSLALRDVGTVLKTEPNNLMAIEIAERVKKTIENQGSSENEVPIDLIPLPEYLEPLPPQNKVSKEKAAGKKKIAEEEGKDEKKEAVVDNDLAMTEENKTEEKLVVEEDRISTVTEDEDPRRTVKLVFGEDIRWAQVPVNCDIFKLREIVSVRFPRCDAVLVKYRDEEGDLVTITSTEELRLANSSEEHGFVKLYIVETSRDQDPFYNSVRKGGETGLLITDNGQNESVCISDWIVQLAQVFKNYAEFDNSACVDLHEVGMKLYTDVMEETVTSEEAQDGFCTAADKFREMAALGLFNWGNVHMSRAKKKVYFTEDPSTESVIKQQVKSAYDWAQMEFAEAGKRYEEALKIKPNLYEAVLALGQTQFEQAKLSWYYAVGTGADLETWPSKEVLWLYNKAEENMEKGMQMWEADRANKLPQPNKIRNVLQKMKLSSSDEAANILSQIHVLWGTMLYERSIMEFKLKLPQWQESLEASVEKLELAGASSTDIDVMKKNHCCNNTASEGSGLNIDGIVHAWNEMYEAKKWRSSIRSFRLEPLLRRRFSKHYYALKQA